MLSCCKTKLRESHTPDVFCAGTVAEQLSAVGANMDEIWQKNHLKQFGRLVFGVQITVSVLQQWGALQALFGVHVMGTVSQLLAHV